MTGCPNCGASVSEGQANCPTCGASLNTALSPGTLLAGKYRLESLLGQGGFGITYRAAHAQLGTPVAVKELFPDMALRRGETLTVAQELKSEFDKLKTTFLEEARTLAKFQHPGVVRVSDVFEANNTAYLVMELLEGLTLAESIQRRGQLLPNVVLNFARKMLEGLERVHEAGMLHRDIKPDNVFLSRDGRIVLLDFGSARSYSGGTVKHTRLVTPGYAPLEQYATSARFGPYTDLYALGATLYHALTGTAPTPAPDRLTGRPLAPLPDGVSPNLAQAIMSSLSLKIEERPQTVAEFRALLGTEAAAPVPVVPAEAKGDLENDAMKQALKNLATAGGTLGQEVLKLGKKGATQGLKSAREVLERLKDKASKGDPDEGDKP